MGKKSFSSVLAWLALFGAPSPRVFAANRVVRGLAAESVPTVWPGRVVGPVVGFSMGPEAWGCSAGCRALRVRNKRRRRAGRG